MRGAPQDERLGTGTNVPLHGVCCGCVSTQGPARLVQREQEQTAAMRMVDLAPEDMILSGVHISDDDQHPTTRL